MFVFICTEVNARWFGFTTGGKKGGCDSGMVSRGKHKLSLVSAGEFVQENIEISDIKQRQNEFSCLGSPPEPSDLWRNTKTIRVKLEFVDECWIFGFGNN